MTTGKRWFVYLVRAVNGALYCGITDDVWRRYAQHRSGRGARFFRSSPPQALVYVEAWSSKGEALSREHAIKRLSKTAKEALVHEVGPLAAVLAALGLEQSAESGQQE